jgi:hypothetical protein
MEKLSMKKTIPTLVLMIENCKKLHSFDEIHSFDYEHYESADISVPDHESILYNPFPK